MEHSLPVIETRWYSEGVFELSLERAGLAFTPGDCLALFAGDGRTSRPYSVASGTGEDRLRFVIRRIPGGAVSDWLADRRPGDRVGASPPFGWFRPGETQADGPSVFVATGTGISPFLSWLRSHPDRPPAMCLHGVRTLADAAEADWIAAHCPHRLAVSREAVAGYHAGRVTDLFEALPWSPRHHYYLCGLDAMIDEASRYLEGRGTAITRIHRECFFNASEPSPAP